MARTNPGKERFGSMAENVTAPDRTIKEAAAKQVGAFSLPTLGPLPKPSPISNPLLGYAYRDNETFTENFDRIEVIQRHYYFSMWGSHGILSNGSANVTGSAVEDIQTQFWPNVYTYLHEMAQKRDGYRATASSLNSAYNLLNRDNLLVALKINIRTLAQLYTVSLVNEGLKSTIPGFRKQRSRILRALEASNRLVYPQAWDKFIEYWSTVYAPWGGGPAIANLFSLDFALMAGGSLAPSASAGVATIWAGLPDLTSDTDVSCLLNDIEVGIAVLERFQANVANTASDLREIDSLYSMMGFPTPQTALPTFKIDPEKFNAQFQRYGFLFSDTKGGGVDTHLFWPDCSGSLDTLINVDFRSFVPDELDFIGGKGLYAFDADDDATPGYTAAANDLTGYGLVTGCNWVTALVTPTVPATKIYTREDTWVELVRSLDYTAAAGCQAHIWSIPDIVVHPESWRAIMSEEAEEAYLHHFSNTDARNVQIPFDHFGQSLRAWLYSAYKIPYIT